MTMADDIGNLIINLNPYTNIKFDRTNRKTGGMNIYVGDPTPTDPPGTSNNIGQIKVEVDTNYPADWSFKGEPQKINSAIRIPYRYPVYAPPPSSGGSPPIIYWVTDYMLIGFEGSGAGG